MNLIQELLQMLETTDPQLQRLRDQKHALEDQIADISASGGEVPEPMKQKMKQLQTQIDAKMKQIEATKGAA